jgi:TetR/AcrR family transcriptional repressor of nem operon
MRYPASETAEKHTRILDEAIRLFRERGFSDVSVNDIMKASGLTHGPFYNHFYSKETLIAECVEHGLRARAIASLDGIPGSAKGKKAYVDRYLSKAERDSPGTGCVIGALASDIRKEPKARAPFTAELKDQITKFTSYFPWRSKRTARGDSIRMVSILLGALILARAVDDEKFSDEILTEGRRGIS